MITSALPCIHGFGLRDESLRETLGLPEACVVMSRQTHSDIVRVVTQNDRERQTCDALVTAEPGLALCIYTADCVPILLIDAGAGVIGAAHAGWRGTANGIAEKTVRVMESLGARPERIQAAIGPALGQCCFETDRDVPDALCAALGDAAKRHLEKRGEKWYADIKGLNLLRLRRAGVSSVTVSGLCTGCRPDLFYSYRKEKSKERQLSIICREEPL